MGVRERGRRGAGFSGAPLESGIFFHFGGWSAGKKENKSSLLEACDMLIHSQISDKMLKQTDALKCQSLKPLELHRLVDYYLPAHSSHFYR